MFATDEYSLPLGMMGRHATEAEVRRAARQFLNRHGRYGTVLATQIADKASRAGLEISDLWERIAGSCFDLVASDYEDEKLRRRR